MGWNANNLINHSIDFYNYLNRILYSPSYYTSPKAYGMYLSNRRSKLKPRDKGRR